MSELFSQIDARTRLAGTNKPEIQQLDSAIQQNAATTEEISSMVEQLQSMAAEQLRIVGYFTHK